MTADILVFTENRSRQFRYRDCASWMTCNRAKSSISGMFECRNAMVLRSLLQ